MRCTRLSATVVPREDKRDLMWAALALGVPEVSLRSLIERFAEYRPRLEATVARGRGGMNRVCSNRPRR